MQPASKTTDITVLVADGHDFVRAGIVALLESEADLQIVGEAADGIGTLRLAEQLRPTVALLDVMLPGVSGLEVLRQMPSRAPGMRAVMLATHDNPAHLLEATRVGALGYVLKGGQPAEIVRAVRAAAAGRRYLAPPLSEDILATYAAEMADSMPDPYETLSAREREVLHLTAAGCTSAEAARQLFISPRTVEGHRATLMHKLNLATRREVVHYALRRGICLIDD